MIRQRLHQQLCGAALNKFFIEKISFNCETCEENAIPCCCKCGSSIFSVTRRQPGKVICCDCGEIQQGSFSFACESGHVTNFSDINEALELIATDDFCEKLFETIRLYYSDIEFSNNFNMQPILFADVHGVSLQFAHLSLVG